MSAFLFIWQKSLRNFIRQLPKKPARFILVLLYTAFFVLAIASVSFMPRAESGRLIEQANGASILQVGWFSLILLIGTAVRYSPSFPVPMCTFCSRHRTGRRRFSFTALPA